MNVFIDVERVRTAHRQYAAATGADKSFRAHQLASLVPELLDGIDAFSAEVERLRALVPPETERRVYDREPPADVTSVCDREGDEWCRTAEGWFPVGGGKPISFPDLRDAWGPITAWPGGA